MWGTPIKRRGMTAAHGVAETAVGHRSSEFARLPLAVCLPEGLECLRGGERGRLPPLVLLAESPDNEVGVGLVLLADADLTRPGSAAHQASPGYAAPA
jgi:hypothetical protein